MASDAPAAAPLPPIIKRSTSPAHAAVSNSALKSPVFSDPPSPGPHQAPPAQTPAQTQPQGGYFGPQPSGILLNKGEGAQVGGAPIASSSSRDRSSDAAGRASPALALHAPEARAPTATLLRVASPDGSTASDGGFSSDGAAPASTVPSSVGSPPAHVSKPTLSTLFTGGSGAGAEGDAALKRANSPPSPHCHFAPLPKPDADRPGTRRNSFANRVKPYVPPRAAVERTDTATSHAVDDEEHPHSPLGTYHPGDSSIPSASALSQRLSSSLTFADARSPTHSPHLAHGSASPSRPTSRRSSSSRRSRSPSPPVGRFRGSSVGAGAGVGAGPAQVQAGSSKSHSPNLSRHASTDALSLHYIEADAEGRSAAAAARERHGISRTSSRAGSDRGGGGGVEWQLGGPGGGTAAAQGAAGDEPHPPGPGGRRASADRGHTLSRTGSSAGFVDKDKEADLHRLVDKAAHGNADAERAVSPALAAQAKRGRSSSRGAQGEEAGRATVLKRKGENEEIVEVAPAEDKDDNEGELEEVLEEPEDEDEEDDDEEEKDGREDGDTGSEEEGEGERSRDLDEEEDEDEEEELHEERKTSKGAAVEVVRWHRPERDQERDQQSSPALRGPSPAPAASHPTVSSPPVLGAPVVS